MGDKIILFDHEGVRDWVGGRSGFPAIFYSSVTGGETLHLIFGQAAYQDDDRPERAPTSGGYDLVEWDEWFKLFDKQLLALVVAKEVPGERSDYYEIIPRPQNERR